MTEKFRTRTAGAIALIVGAAAGSAFAQPVQSVAYGDQLAGGTLEIDWYFASGSYAGTNIAPIVVGAGVRQGTATVADPGGGGGALFIVSGDTFNAGANWRIRNNSLNLLIGRATIDLTGSISLFDNNFGGLFGGTPNSLLGVLAVEYQPFPFSSAPMEMNAFEHDSWAHASNVGDMFMMTTIEWNFIPNAGPVFDAGEGYTWDDDSDLVPAPGAIALFSLAAVAFTRRRARA